MDLPDIILWKERKKERKKIESKKETKSRIRTEIKKVRELDRRARGKCVFYRPVCIISGILIETI